MQTDCCNLSSQAGRCVYTIYADRWGGAGRLHASFASLEVLAMRALCAAAPPPQSCPPHVNASASQTRDIDERAAAADGPQTAAQLPGFANLVPCRLAELAPNVIITQDQCRVCAVSEPQLREAVDSWAAACQVHFISNGRLKVAQT